MYGQLQSNAAFWGAQSTWSIALIAGWIVVAAGYFHQGWMVHHRHTATNVSSLLPAAVFVIQCLLFIKGVFFRDWSLIISALIVNSGVVFSLYQIIKEKGPRWKLE